MKIDELLELAPYDGSQEAEDLFMQALQEECIFHYEHNEMYQRFCDRKGFDPHKPFTIEEMPPVSVSVFKELGFKLNSVPKEDLTLALQSSATSGIPSTIVMDKETAKRQAKAMIKVIGEFIGKERKPFLVMDIDPRSCYKKLLGARFAAVTGYLRFANKTGYFLKADENNVSYFDVEGIQEYVKALGKQIKDAGMAFMLDFHYSDTWADPVKQWTPKAWENLSDEQLYDKIYEYTKDVLTALNEAGATPDFIQTGNEISYGMCWGKSTDATSALKKVYTNNDANWPRFTTLLKRAGAACREVCPEAKIIIHTERVANSGVLKAFYDRMKSYDVDYDIIGLSYYPYYHGTLNTLNSALNDLETRFPEKKIMLVEVGYYHDWQPSNVSYDLSSQYPINGEGQKAFTNALLSKLESHPNVCGLFWWWMEANEKGLDWNTQRVTDNWYNAGLFDNQTGRAEPALYVLKDFLIDNAVSDITTTSRTNTNVYTIDGRQVRQQTEDGNTLENLPAGIYVTNGRKVIKNNK